MAKILILDDEKLICQHLRQLLHSFGYESGFILNPSLLFQRLEEEHFDLILMDINMPKVDGVTLLKQCQEHPEHQKISIIMLTGASDDRLVAECLERGATDFINKPISEIVLKARLETALAAKRSKEELEGVILERTAELQEANQNLHITNLQLQDSYRDLEKVSQTFQLFVPQQFLSHVLAQQKVQAGKFEQRKLSLFFSDIRSYTNLVEHMTPEENFEFLEEFFQVIGPLIPQYHGFVDKFIGDALFALFDQKESASQAIQAAIAIQRAIQKYNEKRKEKGKVEIECGIGINTGSVMLGALGSEKHLNSTVIGDHVNLAARLEKLTKVYKCKILISHRTYQEINVDSYFIRKIDTVMVRGRSEPVPVYEVFDSDSLVIKEKKQRTKEILEKGIRLYEQQNFVEALEVFEQYIRIFPQDKVIFDYLKRCHYFQKHPPRNQYEWRAVSESSSFFHHSIRRRAERYSIQIPISLYPFGVENPYRGMLRDLSVVGLKIELDLKMRSQLFPVKAGEILLIHLFFSNTPLGKVLGGDPYQILGKIVWKKENNAEENFYWQVGFESVVITIEQEKSLQKAIQDLPQLLFE